MDKYTRDDEGRTDEQKDTEASGSKTEHNTWIRRLGKIKQAVITKQGRDK